MSNTNTNEPQPTREDPLIDEVRALRIAVVEEFDNDVHRLCAHLREVEREFETRTGRFADLPVLSADEVTAGWVESSSALAEAE